MSRVMQLVQTWWNAERHRHFLVYSAFLAVGIALYFALPTEPDWHMLLAGLAATIAISHMAWKHSRLRPWLLMLCLTIAGLAWAATYSAQQSLIVLARELTPRPVSGTVRAVERTETGLRITLDGVAIRKLEQEKTPQRIRLSLRMKDGAVQDFPRIGTRIELLAGLLPPMGPAMPGGFDFARYFFFRDIGAVGYGLPPWKTLETPADRGFSARFANWRMGLTKAIIDQLGTRHGAVAAGLITGDDKAIAEEDYTALKAANLYHIIAISGGHMVVISGMIFLLARMVLLALPGYLRFRPQMKSIAAAITLALTTVYLFITGLPPSAVRAYVMIALVLLAVMLRRQVNPMRSLMLAALAMLALDPSDLFEPGFQLSFVATLAIVALVERMFLRHHAQSWLGTAGRIVLATFLIAVVAEAATGPLVAAQFNTFSTYGIFANMVATPLVSLLLMPVVGLYFLLLPFGLEGYALWALDYGIRGLLWIAHTIAAWPHAQWFVPSMPGWGVALFVIGLLWFCFFERRPRWIGVPLMIAGIVSVATVVLPDMLIGQQAKQIALRTGQGYALARGRSDSLVPQLWANALGQKELPPMPRGDAAWRCDRTGCVATVQETRVAFPDQAIAMAEDCERAALVVTRLWKAACAAPVLDGGTMARKGVHALWLDGDGMHLESSADWQGNRRWSAH